jgi:RNA polymerase sigma-70 factor (ECF subfamily)
MSSRRSGGLSGMTTQTVTRVDEAAFAEQVERHLRELQLHCYRMVGSLGDARDLARDALMLAWDRRDEADGRASLRPWLYPIATDACLDFLAARPQRSQALAAAPNAAHLPWLEPYPDHLLDELAWTGAAPAPATVMLPYVVELQHLPPRQRAAQILRDVFGSRAATLAPPDDAAERALLRRYLAAAERGDRAALVALLREDARLTMPQEPLSLDGRDAIAAGLEEAAATGAPGFAGDLRGVATWANRQPAVAGYVRDPGSGEYLPLGLDVLRIEDGAIAEITTFSPELFAAFGLPPTL